MRQADTFDLRKFLAEGQLEKNLQETDNKEQAVVDDVNRILQADPRAIPVQVNLTEANYGLLLECTLSFVTTNQVDTLRLSFDKEIGLIVQQ